MTSYRYTLERGPWLNGAGTVLFVMLNPSTADGRQDDPTIRRCIGFAQSWGFRSLTVGNLYALRATDPRLRLERLVAHRELQFLRAHGRRYTAERARKLAQARGALARLEQRGRVA